MRFMPVEEVSQEENTEEIQEEPVVEEKKDEE